MRRPGSRPVSPVPELGLVPTTTGDPDRDWAKTPLPAASSLTLCWPEEELQFTLLLRWWRWMKHFNDVIDNLVAFGFQNLQFLGT